MAKLVYFAAASLDGYVADENGDFGRAAPVEEVHVLSAGLRTPVELEDERRFGNGTVYLRYAVAGSQ